MDALTAIVQVSLLVFVVSSMLAMGFSLTVPAILAPLRNLKLVLLALLVPFSVFATELPSPPNGYSWVSCKEIKGAFLMPLGWHFKKGMQGETLGYFFTKENIDEVCDSSLADVVVDRLRDTGGLWRDDRHRG